MYDLLSRNEARTWLASQTLPDNFDDRLDLLLVYPDSYRPPVWLDGKARGPLLTPGEAQLLTAGGSLPADFADRLRAYVEHAACDNCDGRECMDCVTRTWHEDCEASCPSCCPQDQDDPEHQPAAG